jgi:mono/diheme cytochrome c family protein
MLRAISHATWFVLYVCLCTAVVLLACLNTTLASAEEVRSLKFLKGGKEVAQLTLAELMTKATPQQLEVFEFQNGEKRTYDVIPFNAVMDAAYGKDWRKSEDILFTCLDGYQPIVPVSEFTKHPAYLAIAVRGAKDFTVFSKIHQNTTVDLGPFYLVWKNIGDAVLMAQGPNWWPYQLTTVDLVRFADKSAKLAPPANAKPDAKEGFALFRKTCLACHTLNGEGGQSAGVELNRPVNVTKYWKKEWLAKWIASPKSLRESTKMPDYGSESGYKLPADVQAKQIQQIIAYLESMAK